MVRVVLGSLGPGRFGWEETRLTAACLGIFSVGIFASALIPFICRAFFSFKDTKTPTYVAVFGVALNILLSYYFVQAMQASVFLRYYVIRAFDLQGLKDISVAGLPLAFSVAVISQFILLLLLFYKKIGDFRIKEILYSFGKILIASGFLTIFTYLTLRVVAGLVDMKTFIGVFVQGVSAGLVGILIYFLVTFFLKSSELRIIKWAILKQFSKD